MDLTSDLTELIAHHEAQIVYHRDKITRLQALEAVMETRIIETSSQEEATQALKDIEGLL